MAAVEFDNVSKVIRGKTILDSISMSLEPKMAYGFYGHNGSGKSMLFRAVAGFIRPTSGAVTVFGKKIGSQISFPENMGLIIENVGFWPHYNGFDNLKMLASIKNVISDNDIKTAIKKVGLDPEEKKAYSKYSLGMKQRLGIAQAIMEKPDLLLLDEPTNALDDDGVELIRGVVGDEVKRGATVLIASHNKEDLKQLCCRFFKMSDGRLSETSGDFLHEK